MFGWLRLYIIMFRTLRRFCSSHKRDIQTKKGREEMKFSAGLAGFLSAYSQLGEWNRKDVGDNGVFGIMFV